MTKTDISIYRGLKERFNPEEHIGFFITSDTGELLLGDLSLGQTIVDYTIEDGVLTLNLNTGKDVVVTFPEATGTVKGLLSAEDKALLIALQANLDSKVDKVTGKSLIADSEITKLAGLPNSTELTNSIATAKAAGDNAQSDLNAHKQNTSNPHQVTKAQVGLGSVTNDAQVRRSEMGVANGVATLDATGKVPAAQLPSFVDDIVDVYATYSKSSTGVLSNIALYSNAAKTLLVTGEAGKIYQNVTNGEPGYQFRWTGTVFAQTGASSLIIGEVAGTAYDGAKGKANADNINKIKGTSLSHIKDAEPITTAANKVTINYECFEGEQYGSTGTAHTADIPAATPTKAGVMSSADKAKLEGIAAGAEVNVQSDWNATGGDAFIKNKPAALPASDVSAWAKAPTKPAYTKAEVGLGNVDNTSDVNKPVSTAQATAIADAKKAGTGAKIALDFYKTANDAAVERVSNDLANHKADNDKKHIPEGGHERQILAWSKDGEAKWEDLANMFPGLEELLAYGVEWDEHVADPHLTRIGNMSLHKTLPIQSLLKGCIAQSDKVIYWLDETDWRFRKDATKIAVDLTASAETFTVPSVEGLGINQYLRNGECLAKITAIDAKVLTITVAWELPEVAEGGTPIDLTTITSLEIGSRLDGYDGTVRVYCPNFYIKSQIIGTKRRVWLSTVKIDNTWTYLHEILIDAYRSTVLNTVPENMGYLSTLPVNSAISVVNTETYCRGGNNDAAYDKYLTGINKIPSDIFRTLLGKPRTYLSRSNMREYSRNAKSEMLSYDQYKNIFYWLYVVEYANFNSLEAYNEVLTDEGYHLGGLGLGVSGWSRPEWTSYSTMSPITPCGYGNDLGNGTGLKTIITSSVNFNMPRWRGFDNPFGDIMTNLDGIIIDATAGSHRNNRNYVYTCQDPAKYADNLNGEGYEKVGEEIRIVGNTKLFDLGDAAHIIPYVHGGYISATYKCDLHFSHFSLPALKTLFIGGCTGSDYNAAGLCCFFTSGTVTSGFEDVGFRSVSLITKQDN